MSVPKKKFYRMGEVCKMTELEPHVLRFWESEFEALAPRKTRTGHRTFTEADINLIRRIKRLLHDEGFTIAGARKRLAENHEAEPPLENATRIKRIHEDISEIKTLLRNVLNMLDQA